MSKRKMTDNTIKFFNRFNIDILNLIQITDEKESNFDLYYDCKADCIYSLATNPQCECTIFSNDFMHFYELSKRFKIYFNFTCSGKKILKEKINIYYNECFEEMEA